MEKITQKKKYFVVRERAVPEVLLKVVQAKKLLDSEKVSTVQEAAEQTGISRSSFYKYKDDIFPFHEETRGKGEGDAEAMIEEIESQEGIHYLKILGRE